MSYLLSILGIILLFCAVRYPRVAAPLIRDEGEYAYAAQLLQHGLLPYQHSFLQKPPMVVYSYAIATGLVPNVYWSPRIFSYLCAGIATLLLAYAARIEFGRQTAQVAAWLLTPMLLLPKLEQYTANTEQFLLVPLLCLLALYLKSRKNSLPSPALWFTAGICSATALCFKYTVLPVILVIWCWWSIEEFHSTTAPKRFLKFCAYSAGGVALGGALILAPFLISDGGRSLWECTVEFNKAYAQSNTFGWGRFGFRLHALWADWWLLFLIPFFSFLRSSPRLWFWVSLFVASWVGTAGSYYTQYYVPVMPFWAVLAAAGLCELGRLLEQRFSSRIPISRVIAAIVVLGICSPDIPVIARGPLASEFDPINPFPECRIAARQVRQLTAAEDRVFVAGSEPQILSYAQRFSPTRFVIAYPLMFPHAQTLAYQQELIRDLEHEPPSVIVKVQASTSWLEQKQTPRALFNYLDELLKNQYEPLGGYVLDSGKGCWMEPLPSDQTARATLVLFRRKLAAHTPVVTGAAQQ